MASCVRNIHTKNYQNLIIDFQVTVENVWDVFLRHSVVYVSIRGINASRKSLLQFTAIRTSNSRKT